ISDVEVKRDDVNQLFFITSRTDEPAVAILGTDDMEPDISEYGPEPATVHRNVVWYDMLPSLILRQEPPTIGRFRDKPLVFRLMAFDSSENRGTSEPMSIDISDLPPIILFPPPLVTHSSAFLIWQTDVEATTTIEYVKAGNLKQCFGSMKTISVVGQELSKNHHMMLKRLQPYTRYLYRLKAVDRQKRVGWSRCRNFQTTDIVTIKQMKKVNLPSGVHYKIIAATSHPVTPSSFGPVTTRLQAKYLDRSGKVIYQRLMIPDLVNKYEAVLPMRLSATKIVVSSSLGGTVGRDLSQK
ncbi:MAG: fibronectin type III domain-containing protein, partial [Deltaproteobacteria bacterium]|nr:fibronectin type III domain-containing protein [Deltaproteobacteria bacterium]